jgi:hypothetical protein
MKGATAHRGTEFGSSPHQPRSSAALLPIMSAVFIAFIVIGLAVPVLPLHVHQSLGLGTFLVGLVAGSEFGAAIVSRVWAGQRLQRPAQHDQRFQVVPQHGSPRDF